MISSSEKLRIGVLMGGKSIEREVSFNSGRTICDHLDSSKYTIIPIFQTEVGSLFILPKHFVHRGKIADFRHRLDAEGTKISWDVLKKTVDFVYIAVHGRYAEDGTLQGMLEVLGIPYLGSKILGSATGMDKAIQKDVLKAHGVDVARGIVIQPHEVNYLTDDIVVKRLEAQGVGLPCLVKPAHEGSSLGISVIAEKKELLPAIIKAMHADEHRTQTVMVEEKLTGMEFVCVALEKRRQFPSTRTFGSPSGQTAAEHENNKQEISWYTLPLTEVIIEDNSQFFDYEQKYMPGRAAKVTPARCTEQDRARIAQTCITATKALNFATISRIDGFLTDDGRVVIIDPNTLTGMAPATFLFHQAAEVGMSHTQLINLLIEHELQQYGLDTQHFNSGEKSMVQKQKTRVAVLLGGDSNEREISLESGRNVCFKLSPEKYDVVPLFVNDNMDLYKLSQRLLLKNSTREIAHGVTQEDFVEWSDLPSIADFVFIALHGGKGENGAIQGTLEMLELPYNGSGVLASALCIDKFKTNNFLRSLGFHVPNSVIIDKKQWVDLNSQERYTLLKTLVSTVNLPLIVKPHDDGCSVMVKKADSREELAAHLDLFFASQKTQVMLEEFIQAMELTCGVLGNTELTALPPSMVVAKHGILSIEEKFLPGEGENQTPAPLTPDALKLVHETMKAVYQAVGCKGYVRIDCFYQEAQHSPTQQARVIILEINSLPGMTPATCLFHQAAEVGMHPMELIDKIIELGFDQHRKITHTPEKPVMTASIDQAGIFDAPDTGTTKIPETPEMHEIATHILEKSTETREALVELNRVQEHIQEPEIVSRIESGQEPSTDTELREAFTHSEIITEIISEPEVIPGIIDEAREAMNLGDDVIKETDVSAKSHKESTGDTLQAKMPQDFVMKMF